MDKACLLIDGRSFTDLIVGDTRKLLLADLSDYQIVERRIYGNFIRNQDFKQPLMAEGFDVVCCTHPSTKKVVTEMQIAMDVVELLHCRPEINTFVLVADNADYSAVFETLKAAQKEIIWVCHLDRPYHGKSGGVVDRVLDVKKYHFSYLANK